MRKIYIIGTLHDMLPDANLEFVKLLAKINPDQILVEITKSDLARGTISSYPKEMISAYQWAVKNNVKVSGFDYKINILKRGVGKKDIERAELEMDNILQNKTWKEMNKKRYDSAGDKIIDTVIDSTRSDRREKKMVENIRKRMLSEGSILVITGSAHLKYFETNLKTALFPLRN